MPLLPSGRAGENGDNSEDELGNHSVKKAEPSFTVSLNDHMEEDYDQVGKANHFSCALTPQSTQRTSVTLRRVKTSPHQLVSSNSIPF